MDDPRRAGRGERAERQNEAVELLGSAMPIADAARLLAQRWGLSVRQARRYLDRAAVEGSVPVPESMVTVTARVPASVRAALVELAAAADLTLSAVVAEVLSDDVGRRGRDRGDG